MNWFNISPADERLVNLLRTSATAKLSPNQKDQLRRTYLVEYRQLTQKSFVRSNSRMRKIVDRIRLVLATRAGNITDTAVDRPVKAPLLNQSERAVEIQTQASAEVSVALAVAEEKTQPVPAIIPTETISSDQQSSDR